MTTISWTHAPGYTGVSWNPIAAFNKATGKRGWFCTKPSAGCKHCYAESRNLHVGNGLAYTVGNAEKVEVRLMDVGSQRIEAPFSWRKPHMVFVCSMTDLFLDLHSDEMIAQIVAVMALTPQHTYQVLTKRPERMLALFTSEEFRELVDMFVDAYAMDRTDPLERRSNDLRATAPDVMDDASWPLPNLWAGATTENQTTADERIPILLQVPAAVRWVSAEPLLGPIDLSLYLEEEGYIDDEYVRPLDWVVPGLESGLSAREGEIAWIVALIEQCRTNRVPCFVKQLGRRPIVANDDRSEAWPGASIPLDEKYEPHHQGELAPLSLVDQKGEDWSEWPTYLRVREWPRALAVRAA